MENYSGIVNGRIEKEYEMIYDLDQSLPLSTNESKQKKKENLSMFYH